MRWLLLSALGLVVLLGGGLVTSASVISKHRQEEFKAFDVWERDGARQATVLADAGSEAFRCERPPQSTDSAKQLLGVVDFSASLRSLEGVPLPFDDQPSVATSVREVSRRAARRWRGSVSMRATPGPSAGPSSVDRRS